MMKQDLMIKQDLCKSCGQKGNCSGIYEQMGGYRGPSVLSKVFCAFVIPLLTFIVSLVLFEEFAAESIRNEKLRTFTNFALASIITFTTILLIRFVNRKFGQDKQNKPCKF